MEPPAPDAIGRFFAAPELIQLTIQQAFERATQFHQAGRISEAKQLYEQILAVFPRHAEALNNLGLILRDTGRLDESVAAYRRAIAINPGYADAYYNLGISLSDLWQLDAAISANRQAIALHPTSEAHNNLGNALLNKGELDGAIAAFRQAIALRPDSAEAYNNLGNALKDSAEFEAAISAYRQAVTLIPSLAVVHSNWVYTLLFVPDCSGADVLKESRRWNAQHAAPLRGSIPAHTNDRSSTRRLRIGYVSPDFRAHPVGRFMKPLLQHHNRNEVEVYCYSAVPYPDVTTSSLREQADVWRDISALSDEQAAQRVREDRVDILVDLTMHMAGNRLLLFAREPAPVQVTYLAYCGTTGMDGMHYRISDPWLDPPGEQESIYSEQTIRLPRTYWCYEPLKPAAPPGPPPAVANGYVTFGCLNNFGKVSQPALAAWRSLMQRLSTARLILHAALGSHRNRVAEFFRAGGVNPDRIEFAGRLSLDEYFETYRRIDIALDPFPYVGGTTTCDALWMGVPVVTLSGVTGVSRGGVSILSNLELPELIASTPENYISAAAQLVEDLPRLTSLRNSLSSRLQKSPLMDSETFTRDMEACFRQMWRLWC
jgi:protein O-GlcNAc transferase